MATNTKNYNFKKPDESDFYDIQDQNGNWDIADEKMEELSAPTFEDYSGTTSVPEASTAIEAIKSKKKIPEILANIKAAFKGVCLLGHIVNNCVTDNAKLPLSAAQGKALMDQIAKLNSDLFGPDSHKIFKIVKQVPPGSEVNIGTYDLPAGKWLLIGHIDWDKSSEYQFNFTMNGRVVRASAINGGGANNISVLKLNKSATLPVGAYIGGGVGMTARVDIDAIKIG